MSTETTPGSGEPQVHGHVWSAGTVIIQQLKTDHNLAAERLLAAVRQNRLDIGSTGLGVLALKLRESKPDTTLAEIESVQRKWDLTQEATAPI